LQKLFFACLVLAVTRTTCASDLAPALQWVTTTGGSGSSLVTADAADKQGNLYIVGSTTSPDFPATNATQPLAGGSQLMRIDLSGGGAHRLYPANLPPITFAAAVPSKSGTLLASSGNRIFQSTDAGTTWAMIFQFPSSVSVSGLAIDPSAPSTVYASTTTIGIEKSTDGGLTWTAANNGIPVLSNGAISARSVWVQPTAPDAVFASGNFGLTRSTDGGNTWTLTGTGNSPSVLAFDPFTSATLYSGSGSAISKSIDNGASFVHLSSLPNQAAVYSLAADPRHQGVLYAGGSAGIFQSTDGGVTWNLKVAGVVTALLADPDIDAFYASLAAGTVKTTDGFTTTVPLGLNQPSIAQLLVSGTSLFVISAQTTDAFAVKLDSNGNVVYSTYFGGSGNDAAVALAAGSDGSLYITGSTNSVDLPVTSAAYLTELPTAHGGNASFVLKLNPDGSVSWATYFTENLVTSIAVDANGDPFIAGSTGGGLPTTPGAYQTDFEQNVSSNGFFSLPGPLSAFVTKFNPSGAALVYSTYIPFDNQKNTVQGAGGLVVDSAGNVWLGVTPGSGIATVTGTAPSVVELNSAGSGIVASAVQAGLGGVAAIALDSGSNVYIAGTYTLQNTPFPSTPGAFQPVPQPVVPTLAYQSPSGGGADAFVAKWDNSLTNLLAATLLGGELPDAATSVAVDSSGAVIVAGYTDSQAFPTHAPLAQSFAPRSGFVVAFDANLSNLLFSTYLGDGRSYAAAAAVPDGSGNILLAGSTLTQGSTFIGGDNGASYSNGGLVIANKISLAPASAVRLDSVQNYGSHIAQPPGPGEPVMALGAGFGNSAQLLLDGTPLATISASATSIVALMPDAAPASYFHTVQVSNGTLSNSFYTPAAAAAPAIYTVSGSGAGQGYILNSDGTLNSPANPAAGGSAITIYVAGEGLYTLASGYAVTALAPAVFIDGFYCDGIAAVAGPVDGLPGNVYRLSVYVPDPAALESANPDLKNFKFPAQSSIQLVMGPGNSLNFANSPMVSQSGVFINIK
jgi:uncharacterized protein (TIGR03437 family)